MRRFFPSKTLRNFRSYVSPEIDVSLGGYSFEEVVKRVHHSLRMQIDARELGRQIGRNVRAERHPLIRVAPLFVKDLVLSVSYQRIGEDAYSGVLSNLGRIVVPHGRRAPHRLVRVPDQPELRDEEELRRRELPRHPPRQLREHRRRAATSRGISSRASPPRASA